MEAKIDDKLTAQEVVDIRATNGWGGDVDEWSLCLAQNLLNVSVRSDEGVVVGVGFLCGNTRHAELVDLVVHPDYRKAGLGRQISQLIISYALDHKIKYLGLTYDVNSPWLKTFYESEGFRTIGFAMLHESSL